MIEENEFKKLTSNGRDWLIYQLLSEKSQETVEKEIKSEHVSGVNIEKDSDGKKVELSTDRVDKKKEKAIPSQPLKPTEPKTTQEIVWTWHNNKKFKPCKYKCGNYVSWDNTTKKYIHYDSAFKLIGECPNYG